MVREKKFVFIRYLKRIARSIRHTRSNPNLFWSPSAAFVTTPCSNDDKYRSEVEFEDRLLKPVLDTAEAQWIIEGLNRTPQVNGYVPAGFERYARILHPGWRIEKGKKTPVRWADTAKFTGRPFHRLSHWPEISGMPLIDGPAVDLIVNAGGVVIDYPDEGKLPEVVAEPLRDILAQHVPPGESCWFGVWIGFGCDYKPEIPPTLSINTGDREWDLFKGPVEAVGFQFFPRADYTANVIWPDGRTWFVGTDIDLDTTYIGGSAELIDELLGAQGLEAVEAYPDDYATPNDSLDHAGDPDLWQLKGMIGLIR